MKTIINKTRYRSALTMAMMILFTLFIISSCKAPEYPIENADSYSKVFLQSASNGAIVKNLPIEDKWTDIKLGAGFGGLTPNSENIEVDLIIDPSSLAVYNNINNTNYEMPPADSYRFPDGQISIAKGTNSSNSATLSINASKLQGTKPYLIPVTINKVSPDYPIQENLKTSYYLVNGFYETNPFSSYPQTGWEIIDYSSDDTDAVGGRARFCIDNNKNTCWLSQYRRVNNVRPVHPHHVAIDMKQSNLLHGVTLFGRLGSSNAYLFPKNVKIETSQDGIAWITSGIFTITASATDNSSTMYFEKSVSSRYFRVTVLSSFGNGDTTGIAELYVF